MTDIKQLLSDAEKRVAAGDVPDGIKLIDKASRDDWGELMYTKDEVFAAVYELGRLQGVAEGKRGFGSAVRVSFHGMYDAHLFHRYEPESVDHLFKLWLEHEPDEKYGATYLCPASLVDADGKDVRRVGKMIFSRDNKDAIDEYRAALLDDADIVRLLNTRAESQEVE